MLDKPIRSILCALLLSGGAEASQLSRCVGDGGAVSIQHAPCPPRSRISWTREVGPEDRSKQELDRIRGEQQQRMDDARRLAAIAGTLPHADSRSRGKPHRTSAARKPSRCEAARQDRDRIPTDGKRAANYDTRRALNDRVFDACR